MLKNCLKYFDEILNLAKNLVTLNNLFINYYLKSSNPNSEAKKLIGSLSILTDEVSKHDILQDIESLKKLDKDGTINEEKAKNLCGKLYNMHQPTFLEMFEPFMRLIRTHVKGIVSQYKDFVHANRRRRILSLQRENVDFGSNWRSATRSLGREGGGDQSPSFRTDSDTVTLSFSETATINFEAIGQPLNRSIVFP